MAIAYDNSTDNAGLSSVSGTTYAHTTGSGDNRVMVVVVNAYDPFSASDRLTTSVTYNSVALTNLFVVDSPSLTANLSFWGVTSPDSGAHNVVVTQGGTVDGLSTSVVTFTGNDGMEFRDADSWIQGSAVTSQSINVNCTKTNACIIGACNASSSGWNKDASQTQIGRDGSGFYVASYELVTAKGNNAHAYSGSLGNVLVAAISILPKVNRQWVKPLRPSLFMPGIAK